MNMGFSNPPQDGLEGRQVQEKIPDSDAILIGLGANLVSRFGEPVQTLRAALAQLDRSGVRVVKCSRFWRSAPVPYSDQPWFVNAVAKVETNLTPRDLLATLHVIEAEFGRVRSEVNAPRVIDLDLLCVGQMIQSDDDPPILPHPRLAERAFVLLPLAEVAPLWVHPVSHLDLAQLTRVLSPDQLAVPMG
jgi:2-amino-4-hydroxy-6-hydroxymethyldihydropteridine diphosphokinase